MRFGGRWTRCIARPRIKTQRRGCADMRGHLKVAAKKKLPVLAGGFLILNLVDLNFDHSGRSVFSAHWCKNCHPEERIVCAPEDLNQ
jgi:hypothetical protein